MKRLFPLLALLAGIACAPFVMADDFSDGQLLYRKSRYEQAFTAFQKAARAGNPEAQYALGTLYLEGSGIQQDIRQAFYWIEKAANLGYVPAQLHMAAFYTKGEGTRQDYRKAFQYYKEAAEQDADPNSAETQFMLAGMYYVGFGVKKDDTQALYWAQKAADKNHAQAQYQLGFLYDKGLGTQQDPEKAVYWYEKSAKQGYQPAVRRLAEIFLPLPESGHGTEKTQQEQSGLK